MRRPVGKRPQNSFAVCKEERRSQYDHNLVDPNVLVFDLRAVLAIGDWISNLTKSKISGMLIAMLLYLIGFQTGIIPANSINDTGIPAIASNFAIMMLLVGMGTMIHLKEMIAQWKTVVVALFALLDWPCAPLPSAAGCSAVSGRCVHPPRSPAASSPVR